MTQEHSKTLIYRWGVFLLALGYAIYFVATSDYSTPLGPFRFLTIWALFASVISGFHVLQISRGQATRRWDGFIGMTAVLNAMVVFLYWKLFFEDPASVTRDGKLGAWYLEFYLHLLGPVLQWIDALFLHRTFRAFRQSALLLVGITAAYLIWAELVVQPLNVTPTGSVTSGLPYPFLNNLELPDRLTFYAGNVAASLAFLSVFFALGWGVKRFGKPDP